jgi:hypothetical protein
MRLTFRPVLGLALAAAVAGCSHGATSVAPNFGSAYQPMQSMRTTGHVQYFGSIVGNAAEVCAQVDDGFARCLSLVRLDTPVVRGLASPDAIFGQTPADFDSAYKLTNTGGKGETVAVVDAYDDPNAESDLAVYRKQWKLPACGKKNLCFEKLNEHGKPTPLPPVDTTGWSLEESLDVDMVSAICPKCKIRLVEGNSNSFSDLATAVDAAAKVGAVAISNSYGGSESGGSSENKHYDHPGHIVTASNGDGGYGVIFPSSSQYVVAVGGTTLTKASGKRGWAETVWSGTGSGCSAVFPKPAWQKDKGCKRRTVGDTAADANPGTGPAVYDTFLGEPGWIVVGGTSVSSPIVASVYALAGNTKTLKYASSLYSAPKDSLFDVISGSNGSCTPKYLCTGEKGYDGPTGNGTPDGLKAF